jgi:uncharacterized coiled-coil protein SlyX
MADPAQQLFDLWKKQLEEGAQAWARLLGQAPAPADPVALWRQAVEQWTQAWARMLGQTPLSPDVLGLWKQFLDQSLEAWSRALGQAMHTEAFAQLLGRYLDQWLSAAGPVRRAVEPMLDQALATLNLASRSQLTQVARQIVELDERVERVEDHLRAVVRKLDELLARAGAAPAEGR